MSLMEASWVPVKPPTEDAHLWRTWDTLFRLNDGREVRGDKMAPEDMALIVASKHIGL